MTARPLTTALVALGLLLALAGGLWVAVGGSRPTVAIDATASRDGMVSDAKPAQVQLEGDVGAWEVSWVSGAAFSSNANVDVTWSVGDGCIETSSDSSVAAPLDLPNGARIHEVTAWMYDEGPNTVNFYVNRFPVTEPGAPPTTIPIGDSPFFISSDNESGGDNSGYQGLTDDTVEPPDSDSDLIDKSAFRYEVDVEVGEGTKFCGAQIFWSPEPTDELVFHAVAPCAILDTRTIATGRKAPLAAGESVEFDAVLDDYSTQGGVDRSCGLPDEIGGTDDDGEGVVAVEVNLVALNAAGDGNLKLWSADDGEPDGGVLVYRAGINTNVVLPIGVGADVDATDGGGVSVKNNGSSTVDVRAVVVGYYTRPLVNQE